MLDTAAFRSLRIVREHHGHGNRLTQSLKTFHPHDTYLNTRMDTKTSIKVYFRETVYTNGKITWLSYSPPK